MKYCLLIIALLLPGCMFKEQTANPASVYCEKNGGRVEIVKTPTGEKGYCHLKDGSVMDEWTFFREGSH